MRGFAGREKQAQSGGFRRCKPAACILGLTGANMRLSLIYGLKEGGSTVDWDAVASNCSTGSFLFNFNKWISSRTLELRNLSSMRVSKHIIPPSERRASSRWLHALTANLRTKILDFRGFDSSKISMLRGEILRPIGNVPESLRRRISIGIILVGRLGVGGAIGCVTWVKVRHPRAPSARWWENDNPGSSVQT